MVIKVEILLLQVTISIIFIKKKKEIILIDDNPKKTYDKIPKNIISKKIITNYFSKNAEKKLAKILLKNKKKKYLFLTNYAFLIKYYWLIDEFLKKDNKLILTIHSGLLKLTIKNYLAGLVFSFLYKKINYLFFGSLSAKSWWKLKYPWMNLEKYKIHKNGVFQRTKKKKKNIKKKIINISFVGRLEKENNPNFFVDIAEECKKREKNFKFHIFGEGSLKKALKKSKSIKFHGWTIKKKIYSISDIIIITSPINNFPYVALEAKSYGIPVISCSKGDIKDIIRNNKDGFLKYTASTRDMIKLIYRVINKYDFFSKNCLIRSKYFELNNACNKFWKTIDI
jgi:glycosyltransferase involved in cell wall biosynthesis